MYNPVMLKSKFDTLRRRKALSENRDLSIRTVAAESGLAVGTIQRVRSGDAGKVNLSTVETLCRYFAVSSIAEVIEYIPEDK
jgi:DNA-binding Xre family transcriptional regulator